MKSTALLGLVPALPLLVFGVTAEYWGRICFLWGAAFAVLNCTALGLMLHRGTRDQARPPTTVQFFFRQSGAWCVSFLVLAAINVTPLCQGRDNGDGRNSLTMCLFLTVVWFVSMSVLVMPGAFATSMIARRIVVGWKHHDGGLQ
jgi:hypothetical protein